MMPNICIFLFFATFFVKESDAVFQSAIKEKFDKYKAGKDFFYPCSSNQSACNLVLDRIWFSAVVIQLCKCTGNSGCPDEWSNGDEHTMFINPRAQLKFCSSVTSLPLCTDERAALTDKLKIFPADVTFITEVKCYCPKFHYLKETSFHVTYINETVITKTYVCQRLHTCDTGEFCGNITSDLYHTYHTCTCPPHHLCLIGEDTNKISTREAFYEGDAYRGVCVPW